MNNFIRNFSSSLEHEHAIRLEQCLNHTSDARILLEDNFQNSGKTTFIPTGLKKYRSASCFEIINDENHEILLWAIDGCFVKEGYLSSQINKVCDAAFGFVNCICFIEFKTNADPEANPLTIQYNREHAINQIAETIKFIKNKLNISGKFQFPGYTIEAYIVTPPSYPRKNNAIASLAIKFLEEFGVALFEERQKKIS